MITTVPQRLALLLPRQTTVNCCRTICATREQRFFHEYDPKGGYPRISDYKKKQESTWESLVQGYKYLVEELTVFKKEVKEKISMDPTMIYRPGEVDVTWRFNGDQSMLDKWVVTCDSDYAEGNSTASLQLSPRGKGIFSGYLDPQEIRDGKIKRSGYCNVKSVRPRKSFYRETWLDWGPYTHLVMRVRGDGRNYLLTLGVPGEYDLMWNDSYQYVLYTRGGPYWQYVKVPFSKFFFVSKGRVQDTQQPVPTHQIAYIGITASDKIRGNFNLEIDYIGVEYDPAFDEKFAYEMYKPPTRFHI